MKKVTTTLKKIGSEYAVVIDDDMLEALEFEMFKLRLCRSKTTHLENGERLCRRSKIPQK